MLIILLVTLAVSVAAWFNDDLRTALSGLTGGAAGGAASTISGLLTGTMVWGSASGTQAVIVILGIFTVGGLIFLSIWWVPSPIKKWRIKRQNAKVTSGGAYEEPRDFVSTESPVSLTPRATVSAPPEPTPRAKQEKTEEETVTA